MFLFAENLQFAVTVVFIYLLAKLSPVGSISHWWMKGLEFCVPPSDDYIEELLKETPRKRSKKRPPPAPDRKPVVLHLAQISSPCLQDHFFFEEFDLLVISAVLIFCTLCFYEIWSFIAPLVISNGSKVILQSTTIGFGIMLVVVGYCMRLLFSVVKQAGSESYEMRFSLLLGICSSILCFFVIDTPDSLMNFKLHEGFDDMLRLCHHYFPHFPTKILNFTIYRSVLAIFSGYLAGITVFPGLRLARCHFLLLNDLKAEGILAKVNFAASAVSFVLPFFCILSWVRPLTKDILVSSDEYESSGIMTDTTYETIQVVLLIFLGVLRLYLVRPYIQSYLNHALGFADLFINCTDKRVLIFLRDRIYGVYAYLCVACVQLIAPIFLLLFFALEMRTKGRLSLGILTTPEISLHSRSLLTPLFVESVFSFLAWWFITWWFLVSLVGFIYEKQKYAQQSSSR